MITPLLKRWYVIALAFLFLGNMEYARSEDMNVKSGFFGSERSSGNLFDNPASTSQSMGSRGDQTDDDRQKFYLNSVFPKIHGMNQSGRGPKSEAQIKELMLQYRTVKKKETRDSDRAAREAQSGELPVPPRGMPRPDNFHDRFEFHTRKLGSSASSPAGSFFGERNSGKQARLSLVVSMQSEKRFNDALKKLRYAEENRNVAVGSIVLVGIVDYMEKYAAQRRPQEFMAPDELRAHVSTMPINPVLRNKLANARSASDISAQKSAIYREINKINREGPTPELRDYLKRQSKEESDIPPLLSEMRSQGYGGGKDVNVSKLLKHYGIKNSPAWIVRADGKDYVFEGDYEPSTFFNGQGEFIFRK